MQFYILDFQLSTWQNVKYYETLLSRTFKKLVKYVLDVTMLYLNKTKIIK